jgi:hypothetical protein
LNALFGRYLVLPGYLTTLEQGRNAIVDVKQAVPLWKIIRYLLWAYSFKLGIFFALIGAALLASMDSKRLLIFIVGGLIYLALAYAPLPAYSRLFGIGGGFITLFLLFIIYGWFRERKHLEGPWRKASDFRLVGYFFFAMASYNLCPLMGVKAFALYPEKMLHYGTETEAATFSTHILIELVLGWFFILLSYRKKG